jgi:hypothetical protein
VGLIRPKAEGLSGSAAYCSGILSQPHGPAGPVTCDAHAGRRGAWSPHSSLTRWRGHLWWAGALGAAGPMPRASVLHEECTRRPKDGGSSSDQVATSRWRRSIGSAVLRWQRWPPVVPDDWRCTLQVRGRERERWVRAMDWERRGFGIKIQRHFYELKSRKIHWINLELWNLMKFGYQALCYTILQRKMNFQQKRTRDLNSFWKWVLDWFRNSLKSILWVLNSTCGFSTVLVPNYLLMTLIRVSITRGVTTLPP